VRNTSRAGERVGLSQPAVSAALGRLRHATGDQLFMREGNRMVPTARAEAMAGPVRAALSALERAMAEPDPFEAASAVRHFRLGGSDYYSTLLMPALSARIEAEAPGVVLHLRDLPGLPDAHLASGAADLCLFAQRPTPDWVEVETLFDSRLVGVAARDNPALGRVAPGAVVPAEVFSRLRHGMVSVDGTERGSLDSALERAGISRRVVLTLPHFHAIAQAVSGSELFAALPEHFARAAAASLSLYQLPVEGPRARLSMYWHARHTDDPGARWLRQHVRAACAAIADGP
jgi:DNA-binding transcriptional LysR family regulator